MPTLDKNLNIVKINYTKKNINLLKKIFFKMSYIRQFELQAYQNRLENKFSTLMYLCLGQESIYSAISEALKKVNTFGQHRGHGIYLANGGGPEKLIDELIGLESGTNKGMGGSPPIFDKKIGMYGHVGFIGDQVPVAAGFSLIEKKTKVVCYFGDGAAEEDFVLATFGFASKKKLNIMFICDDNNLSVLTTKSVRRNWDLCEVGKSFGIKTFDITDDPLTIYYTAKILYFNSSSLTIFLGNWKSSCDRRHRIMISLNSSAGGFTFWLPHTTFSCTQFIRLKGDGRK